MAGYFTQGRGLAPRPTGSPRLAPGNSRAPWLTPPGQRARRAPPLEKGRKRKKNAPNDKQANTNQRKEKCKGPHPPLTGQPPALPLWAARAMATLHWHAWLGSLPHSAGVSQSSKLPNRNLTAARPHSIRVSSPCRYQIPSLRICGLTQTGPTASN